MSYDLEIWSVRQLLQAPAETKIAWQAGPGGWSSGTRAWQFVIEDSVRVEPEDLSAEVARSLPGVRYLTRFHLEGDSTSTLVSQALTSAKGIARTIHGLVADAQTNELILPSGVRRLNPIVRASDQERYTELRMSWWFLNDSRMISTNGFDRLLTLLENVLPELLPQRYGTYEPLEFRYKEMGRKHFLEFLENGAGRFLLWKPARPFSVDISFPKEAGASRQGFRTNRISVGVDAELLKQPGWQNQLRSFWEQMSMLLEPIYGDVHNLKGQPRSGWYLAVDPEREEHPLRSWFWRGVPARLGCAVVLGRDYQGLWPEFTSIAKNEAGLSFLSTGDWAATQALEDILQRVPTQIASPELQPVEPGKHAIALREADYPVKWPFGAIVI